MASVLIVEDEPTLRNAYNFVLTKRGFEVTVAENGMTAMDILGSKSFDVIILDMLMPSMSGLDLLRNVKPKTSIPETKILVLSNTESAKIKQEALDLGVGEYLLKVDCTPGEVADKVSELLSMTT